MARNRNKRRHPDEEPPQFEEITASPEEVELSDFLDGLGPQGISEVSVYRLLPSGKQRFITSGPPSQFSEQYVQAQFGEGDYLARAKLNGRWYKSKSFSVEATPGAVSATPPVMPNSDPERERLKAQIESQRLQMERDRQAQDQRNHEFQLKLLEALASRSNSTGPSLNELIGGVEALRNLPGNSGGLGTLKELLEVVDHINAFRESGNPADSWRDILKSVAPEVAQAITQILARNSPAGGTASPRAGVPEGKSEGATGQDTVPLPTAYDQVAGQLRGLLERLQAQAKTGLNPDMAVEALLALEANNDPIASLVMSTVEKSPTFDSWLTWLRSQVGTDVVIESQTVALLSKVFEAIKKLPPDDPQPEGEQQS